MAINASKKKISVPRRVKTKDFRKVNDQLKELNLSESAHKRCMMQLTHKSVVSLERCQEFQKKKEKKEVIRKKKKRKRVRVITDSDSDDEQANNISEVSDKNKRSLLQISLDLESHTGLSVVPHKDEDSVSVLYSDPIVVDLIDSDPECASNGRMHIHERKKRKLCRFFGDSGSDEETDPSSFTKKFKEHCGKIVIDKYNSTSNSSDLDDIEKCFYSGEKAVSLIKSSDHINLCLSAGIQTNSQEDKDNTKEAKLRSDEYSAVAVKSDSVCIFNASTQSFNCDGNTVSSRKHASVCETSDKMNLEICNEISDVSVACKNKKIDVTELLENASSESQVSGELEKTSSVIAENKNADMLTSGNQEPDSTLSVDIRVVRDCTLSKVSLVNESSEVKISSEKQQDLVSSSGLPASPQDSCVSSKAGLIRVRDNKSLGISDNWGVGCGVEPSDVSSQTLSPALRRIPVLPPPSAESDLLTPEPVVNTDDEKVRRRKAAYSEAAKKIYSSLGDGFRTSVNKIVECVLCFYKDSLIHRDRLNATQFLQFEDVRLSKQAIIHKQKEEEFNAAKNQIGTHIKYLQNYFKKDHLNMFLVIMGQMLISEPLACEKKIDVIFRNFFERSLREIYRQQLMESMPQSQENQQSVNQSLMSEMSVSQTPSSLRTIAPSSASTCHTTGNELQNSRQGIQNQLPPENYQQCNIHLPQYRGNIHNSAPQSQLYYQHPQLHNTVQHESTHVQHGITQGVQSKIHSLSQNEHWQHHPVEFHHPSGYDAQNISSEQVMSISNRSPPALVPRPNSYSQLQPAPVPSNEYRSPSLAQQSSVYPSSLSQVRVSSQQPLQQNKYVYPHLPSESQQLQKGLQHSQSIDQRRQFSQEQNNTFYMYQHQQRQYNYQQQQQSKHLNQQQLQQQPLKQQQQQLQKEQQQQQLQEQEQQQQQLQKEQQQQQQLQKEQQKQQLQKQNQQILQRVCQQQFQQQLQQPVQHQLRQLPPKQSLQLPLQQLLQTHQPQTHQPQTHQPQTHQPQTHQPQTHQPQTHQPQTHQPQTHQPQTHQPQAHQPQTHQPQTHQPQTHQPQTHQPQTHQPQTHQPQTHQPQTHQPLPQQLQQQQHQQQQQQRQRQQQPLQQQLLQKQQHQQPQQQQQPYRQPQQQQQPHRQPHRQQLQYQWHQHLGPWQMLQSRHRQQQTSVQQPQSISNESTANCRGSSMVGNNNGRSTSEFSLLTHTQQKASHTQADLQCKVMQKNLSSCLQTIPVSQPQTRQESGQPVGAVLVANARPSLPSQLPVPSHALSKGPSNNSQTQQQSSETYSWLHSSQNPRKGSRSETLHQLSSLMLNKTGISSASNNHIEQTPKTQKPLASPSTSNNQDILQSTSNTNTSILKSLQSSFTSVASSPSKTSLISPSQSTPTSSLSLSHVQSSTVMVSVSSQSSLLSSMLKNTPTTAPPTTLPHLQSSSPIGSHPPPSYRAVSTQQQHPLPPPPIPVRTTYHSNGVKRVQTSQENSLSSHFPRKATSPTRLSSRIPPQSSDRSVAFDEMPLHQIFQPASSRRHLHSTSHDLSGALLSSPQSHEQPRHFVESSLHTTEMPSTIAHCTVTSLQQAPSPAATLTPPQSLSTVSSQLFVEDLLPTAQQSPGSKGQLSCSNKIQIELSEKVSKKHCGASNTGTSHIPSVSTSSPLSRNRTNIAEVRDSQISPVPGLSQPPVVSASPNSQSLSTNQDESAMSSSPQILPPTLPSMPLLSPLPTQAPSEVTRVNKVLDEVNAQHILRREQEWLRRREDNNQIIQEINKVNQILESCSSETVPMTERTSANEPIPSHASSANKREETSLEVLKDTAFRQTQNEETKEETLLRDEGKERRKSPVSDDMQSDDLLEKLVMEKLVQTADDTMVQCVKQELGGLCETDHLSTECSLVSENVISIKEENKDLVLCEGLNDENTLPLNEIPQDDFNIVGREEMVEQLAIKSVTSTEGRRRSASLDSGYKSPSPFLQMDVSNQSSKSADINEKSQTNAHERELICALCHQKAFVVCSACKSTCYCSVKCQKEHWYLEHSVVCEK